MARIPDLKLTVRPEAYDSVKDREMWVGIRSGLLGLKQALSFAHNPSVALGMVYPALGRIIAAIEVRWDLGEHTEAQEHGTTPKE